MRRCLGVLQHRVALDAPAYRHKPLIRLSLFPDQVPKVLDPAVMALTLLLLIRSYSPARGKLRHWLPQTGFEALYPGAGSFRSLRLKSETRRNSGDTAR
jgi:hypothetical protein